MFACCLFYDSYYFIFCITVKCPVKPKHPGSAQSKVLGGARTVFSSPNCAHSLFQSHWSLRQEDNTGHTMGLYYYSSCRFTRERHPHITEEKSGLLLSPCDLEEEDLWEKSLVQDSCPLHFSIWFGPEKPMGGPDSALLPPVEERLSTSRSNLS